MRGPEWAQTVDHHGVELGRVGRFGHAPLQDFLDLAHFVAATLQQGFAFAVVDPRRGREAANLGESRSAEQEARAGVGGLLSGGEQSGCRLVEVVRQVDEPVTSLDEPDLVLAEDVREDGAQKVAFGNDLWTM